MDGSFDSNSIPANPNPVLSPSSNRQCSFQSCYERIIQILNSSNWSTVGEGTWRWIALPFLQGCSWVLGYWTLKFLVIPRLTTHFST